MDAKGNQDKLLIFMHIPKTGGLTLRNIIDQQYNRNEIFKIPRNRLDFEQKMSKKASNDLTCAYGHYRFGIHEYFQRPFTYITMLRDPVDRIISTYYFILQNKNNRLHDMVKNMSLEEFILGVGHEADIALYNHQTRYISGKSEPDLQQAKDNIKNHFAVVGLTEMYNESLYLMKKSLGWKNIYYTKQNITKKRKGINEVSKEIISKIEENNQLDIELYKFVKNDLLNNLKSLNRNDKAELQRYIQKQNESN